MGNSEGQLWYLSGGVDDRGSERLCASSGFPLFNDLRIRDLSAPAVDGIRMRRWAPRVMFPHDDLEIWIRLFSLSLKDIKFLFSSQNIRFFGFSLCYFFLCEFSERKLLLLMVWSTLLI